MLISACGDDAAVAVPDATLVPDAAVAIDARPVVPDVALMPDAVPAPGPLKMTVYDDNGGLVSGATLVTHDATGAVHESVMTDATGQAEAEALLGGMATVSYPASPDGLYFRLITFAEVAPGDDLTVGNPTPEPSWDPAGTISAVLPGVLAGASMYIAIAGCSVGGGDPALPINLTPYTPCLTPGVDVPVLGKATDATANLIAFAWSGAPLGGTATMAAWRTDLDAVATTITNAPSAGSLYTEIWIGRGGFHFWNPYGTFPAGGGGTYQLMHPDATGVADTFLTTWQITLETPGDPAQLIVSRRAALAPGAVTIDLAAMPPRLWGAVGGFSTQPERPSVSWMQDGGGSAADAYVAELGGTTLDVFGSITHSWTFVLPATAATSFQAPALPESLASVRPYALTSWTAQVTLVDDLAVSSWVAARHASRGRVPVAPAAIGGELRLSRSDTTP